MIFEKTTNELLNFGQAVVDDARANLRKGKKETKPNTLYDEMSYLVVKNKERISLEWTFGGAENYWNFVNEGVKGSGGFKGSGKMRGQGSPFSFKKKNIKRGVVLGWIRNKPLKLRNKRTGRFMEKTKANLKTAAFLIGRAIAQRGLTRTLFFDKAYNKELKKRGDIILKAFADDFDTLLKNI